MENILQSISQTGLYGTNGLIHSTAFNDSQLPKCENRTDHQIATVFKRMRTKRFVANKQTMKQTEKQTNKLKMTELQLISSDHLKQHFKQQLYFFSTSSSFHFKGIQLKPAISKFKGKRKQFQWAGYKRAGRK